MVSCLTAGGERNLVSKVMGFRSRLSANGLACTATYLHFHSHRSGSLSPSSPQCRSGLARTNYHTSTSRCTSIPSNTPTYSQSRLPQLPNLVAGTSSIQHCCLAAFPSRGNQRSSIATAVSRWFSAPARYFTGVRRYSLLHTSYTGVRGNSLPHTYYSDYDGDTQQVVMSITTACLQGCGSIRSTAFWSCWGEDYQTARVISCLSYALHIR